MTTQTPTTYPLTRRAVLKSAAAAGAFSAFGVAGTGFVGRAAADDHTVINTCNDLDVVVALDYSGSIRSAGTWPDIQSGVESFFGVVPEDVQLGMVLFGDAPDARAYAPGDYLRLATAANVGILQGEVPAATPPGENATHMPGALAFADAILDQEGRDGNEVIILVTDGGPNYQNGIVGDGAAPPADDTTFPYGTFEFTGGTTGGENGIAGEAGELAETTAIATAIKDAGVRIITVGIGQNVAGFDDYLENNVASTPDDFVAVAEAEDLGAQLQALLTEICDECLPCDDDGQLAKFEYVVEYDEEGVVTFDGFRPDGDAGDFAYVSYENKEGATYDPATATFATEYCSVWAVVKAGQEFSVTELTATDGQVTAEYVAPYAISFVAFFCSEDAATAFAESFPSRGRGRNGRRGR